ncbi:hypothetical protein [Ralstonia pseudosolanacearum]
MWFFRKDRCCGNNRAKRWLPLAAKDHRESRRPGSLNFNTISENLSEFVHIKLDSRSPISRFFQIRGSSGALSIGRRSGMPPPSCHADQKMSGGAEPARELVRSSSAIHVGPMPLLKCIALVFPPAIRSLESAGHQQGIPRSLRMRCEVFVATVHPFGD